MDTPQLDRAVEAATSIATALGLEVDDAVVLHNSNKLALRLRPCTTFARVAVVGQEVAELELALARRLAELGSPVALVEPRVAPQVHTHDGFAVTFWTHYEPVTPPATPRDQARALSRLHAGMRHVAGNYPSFTERIAEAGRIVGDPHLSPRLGDRDRAFLVDRLTSLQLRIDDGGAPEQVLHGEPHPGNLITTGAGPVFIDFETCCRGPVEFDLAHVPEAVCRHYPDLDQDLLLLCRELVLAMVAAWRWERGDEFPNGARFGEELVRILRDGPPWPTLDIVTARLDDSADHHHTI